MLSIGFVVRKCFPVFGGEVVEREQRVAILRQAIDGLVVFGAVALDEGIQTMTASFFVSAIQISCSARSGLVCRFFGSLFRTFAVLWHPAALLACRRPHLAKRLPEAERAIRRRQVPALPPSRGA